jgi:CheY-like chemotaxis protein
MSAKNVLSLGMPDMDGYEVARRISERPEFDDVTLIAAATLYVEIAGVDLLATGPEPFDKGRRRRH